MKRESDFGGAGLLGDKHFGARPPSPFSLRVKLRRVERLRRDKWIARYTNAADTAATTTCSRHGCRYRLPLASRVL